VKVTTSQKDGIVGRPIRLNRKTLAVRSGGYAPVMFIGDIHYGSPQFDKARFLAMLEYCLHSKTYVLLMGDLIEVGTRNSVGAGVYEQECNADDQFTQMVKWLTPLAHAGLILGTHMGN